MSPRIALSIIVLSLPICGLGCPSIQWDVPGPSLPGIGAPEQWEPPIEKTSRNPERADDGDETDL